MYISNHSRTRRALVWVVLPLMVYVLAALFLTWPLPEHISSSTIDEGRSDVFMMVRGAWAANYALRAGHNPLNQSLIVYPNGFTSYMMWATPLRWLPGTLLMFLFSPLAAFNLWLIGTLVMNGVAAYWLGMELSGRHVAAALVGGIVFMAFPSMQGHLREAHIDVLAMYAQPLLALCLWRILYRAAGWRTVGWGGLWFALSCLGLVSQIIYNVLPLFLFMGLYHVIWRRDRLFPRDLPLRDQPWLKIGGMLLLGGLVLLIFFGPLMTNQGRAEMDAVGDATGRIKFSTDPLAFASPSPFGLIGKLGFGMDYAHDVLDTNLTEGAAYLGLVALVLAVVAVALRREARGWLVVALGSMIFSLGPLLKWHNQPVVFRVENTESYIVLPFAALEDLPVINSTRTPGRFNGATALAWSALVSTGAGIAFGWFRRREVQIMLAAGLGAAILVEYQIFWPHEIRSTVQSAYFDQLAARDDVRSVLNIPVQSGGPAVLEAMYQQTMHHKAMVSGMLFRHSPQDPAMLAILRLTSSDVKKNLVPVGSDALRYTLSAVGIDRIIVQKSFVAPKLGPLMRNLTALFGPPEYQDSQIGVFVVPHQPAAWPMDSPIITAGDQGWYSLPDSADGHRRMLLQETGEWYLFTPGEFSGKLELVTQPYGIARRLGVWLDDDLIAEWSAQNEAVSLPLHLVAGFHTLRFEALDGCDPYPFNLACLENSPLSTTCTPAKQPYCVSVSLELRGWKSGSAITGYERRERIGSGVVGNIFAHP